LDPNNSRMLKTVFSRKTARAKKGSGVIWKSIRKYGNLEKEGDDFIYAHILSAYMTLTAISPLSPLKLWSVVIKRLQCNLLARSKCIASIGPNPLYS